MYSFLSMELKKYQEEYQYKNDFYYAKFYLESRGIVSGFFCINGFIYYIDICKIIFVR